MKTQPVQLGEVCQFAYGEALKEENRRSGKVPVYGSNGVVGWHDKALTRGATIVIGRKGSIGEVNWSNGPCFPIDTTYYVEKTERPCDLRWLYYTLLKLDLTRLNKSAAVPGLNRDDAYEQRIPFPDVPQQERIAALLDQADRLRRTRRYALELTDSFLPTAFLELFGDPFAVPSAELARLEDVLEVDPQNGLYVPADRYVANGDPKGTEMVHMSDLFGGIVTPGNLKRALLETSEVAKYQLSERDLLVARRSLAYEGAAQPCRVPALKTPLVFESSMIRIRPDRSRIFAVYLYYYLTNREVRENRVRRYVTISTISGINQDNLCRIEVVVPPLTLQQKFASLVKQVECLRAVQREALRQAEHLFASLLDRSFGAVGAHQ